MLETSEPMRATLYAIPGSHPSYAAELMLQRKGIPYRRVDLPQWLHRGMLRALRFRGCTVPALVLDGRRVQTTGRIARALDAARPDPPLLPADPEGRRRVEEIEAWADGDFQQVARRLIWWALRRHGEAVDSYLEGANLLFPRPLVKPAAPLIIRILAHDHGAGDDAIRTDLAALPGMLDRVDALIAEGVLGGGEPTVADYQVATTLALLRSQDDLRPAIESRPGGALLRRLADGYHGRMPPAYPAEWLAPLRAPSST
jgi:glutathione S-transferase